MPSKQQPRVLRPGGLKKRGHALSSTYDRERLASNSSWDRLEVSASRLHSLVQTQLRNLEPDRVEGCRSTPAEPSVIRTELSLGRIEAPIAEGPKPADPGSVPGWRSPHARRIRSLLRHECECSGLEP